MSSEARTRKALDDLGAKTVTDDPGSQFLDDAEQEKVATLVLISELDSLLIRVFIFY
jgi:hypothetical protein